MTNEQAIQILINAVSLANNKGAFTLGDSKVIIEAIQVLKPETFEQKEEGVEEM